jgi:hypothetical protein
LILDTELSSALLLTQGRTHHFHCECDGEVERVESGFVNDDQVVSVISTCPNLAIEGGAQEDSLGHRVLVEIKFLIRLNQILFLPNLRLESSLVEQFNQIDIIFLLLEMFLEEVVD